MKLLNVVLDLDNTLLHTVHNDEHEMLNEHNIYPEQTFKFVDYSEFNSKIYFRPFLKEFLDELFDNDDKFRVSIFTAGSEDYALDVVTKIILNPPFTSRRGKLKKLKYVYSLEQYNDSKTLGIGPKDLNIFFNKDNTMDASNTVLIDDVLENVSSNGDSAIQIEPFFVHISTRTNKELLKVMGRLFHLHSKINQV